MKDTFIIRTEWYTAIAKLPADDQAVIFRNLFEFHLGNHDKIQQPSFAVELVWGLIAPNLQRNIESYDRRCETSAKNGALGGRPKKSEEPNKPIPEPNGKPNKPTETLNDSDFESDNVTEPDVIPFGVFWDLYDKKVGHKEKLKKRWDKFSEATKKQILDYIPQYIESKPDKQFRKDPQTFFNQESWKDEIIKPQGKVIDLNTPLRPTADQAVDMDEYLGREPVKMPWS